MTKKSLIEIIRASNEINQALIEAEGETNEDIEKSLIEIETRLPEKVDGYHAIIERAKHEARYWEEKASEYLAISKRFNGYAENLERMLVLACDHFQTNAIQGQDWIATKTKASRPKVVIDQETEIPDGFKEITITEKIKKDLILEDMKQGLQVPGVHLEQTYYIKFSPNKKGLNNGNTSSRDESGPNSTNKIDSVQGRK